MKDLLHVFLNKIDHNRYTFLAIILGFVILFYTVGCVPKTKSPLTGKEVTTEELVAEVKIEEVELTKDLTEIEKEIELLPIKTGPAFADLERKRAIITKALQAASILLNQHTGPYGDILMFGLGIAGSIFGGGVKVDNIRKDHIITGLKDAKSTP